ncbi:fimbria/pilus outer membrane usher protein, partial [Pseudomonas aeruginosa]
YNFIQSTAAYGVSSNITLYAGLQQAEDNYTNILMGSGFNLGSIGALSFDASQSLADIKQNETRSTLSQKKGQSLRLRFSKSFI